MHWLKVCKLWVCYCLSFWPAIPGFGRLAEAGCIFVQSFGRNTYTDEELGRVLYELRRQAKSDDTETLKLLTYAGFNPGNSNRALARYAMRIYRQLGGVPIITQWEVAFTMYELDSVWYMQNAHNIDLIWPPQQGYFATGHVKEESRLRMTARGRQRPFELAHPAMVTRAVPIIWGTGLNPVVEEIRMGQVEAHELWIWDPNSIQPWTRNPQAWHKREFVGRVAHVGVHVLALVRLEGLLDLAPEGIRKQLPGNWIRFSPPQPT